MKSIQYTVRNIPKPVDEALRSTAAHKKQSFNQTLLDALRQATGVGEDSMPYDDLDWFIGTGSARCDTTFDTAQKWLDSMPKDLPS